MATLNEMKAQRKVALDAAKALNEADGEDFTAEQQEQFDAYMAESAELEASIAKIEAARARGDLVNSALDVTFAESPTPRPNPARGTPGEIPAAADPGESVRAEVGKVNLVDDPRGGYSAGAEGKFDAKGFMEFALDVRSAPKAGPSEKLTAWDRANISAAAGDGMDTLSGGDGGYLIPVEYSNTIWEKQLEEAIVRPRAVNIPMSGPRIMWPAVNDITHASTVHGGAAAYFTAEEAEYTSSKVEIASKALETHKLTAMAFVTDEMLRFSPISMAAWLPGKLASAMAWKEDQKFLTGTGGAGEPSGIQTSGAVIPVGKEDEQTAKTFTLNNVVAMAARLWRGAGNNIAWVMNRTLEPQVALLSQTWSGGGGQNVFLQDGKIVMSPGKTLYGYPVLFTEHVATLGTAGDVTLINFDEYLVASDVAGMQTETSIHLKFDYGQTAYRLTTRTGGMSPWAVAFTPANGDTLSPFVTLAVRA